MATRPPPGNECCVVEGDDHGEAYTVIVWGVGSSHEILEIAGAEAMCGAVIQVYPTSASHQRF